MTSKLKQEVFPTPLPLSSRKLLPVQMPFEALSMQGVSAHQRCDEFQSLCWRRPKSCCRPGHCSWIWTIHPQFSEPWNNIGFHLAFSILYIYNTCTYSIYIYIWSRFAVRYHPPPPPPWYGPKTCVLQHSAWKRGICSVFCTVGGWRGPQTCKFVDFCSQPSENVLFATFWLRHRRVVPLHPLLCQIVI